MNGMMMDPELMRIAQEQMSRMSPAELARIQQQMMSNPELMRFATESMKNLTTEDIKTAAEQLKHTRPEDMTEIGEKMAKASPEELAAMRAHTEASSSYGLNAAQMLKQQGNDLHGCGNFRDAAQKYLLAKNNLKGIPVSKCKTLQLQCSLNLMSCYLKTRQFEECIKEGSEVLAYDSQNVKALYRRGQAYKEMGRLEAAISDLSRAHEVSPDDETISDVLRDANEKLIKDGGCGNASGGLVIEEIVEEENRPITPKTNECSSVEYSVSPPNEAGIAETQIPAAENECLRSLKDNPEAIRSFQNYISNTNPDSIASMGAGGMPPEMVKTAKDMISKMQPDELQKMFQLASSLNEKNLNFPSSKADENASGPRFGSQFPGMTPEMVNMASETISKMSPGELQKMVEMASSLNLNNSSLLTASSNSSFEKSMNGSVSSVSASSPNISSSSRSTPNLLQTMGSSFSNPTSTSTAGLEENVRNSMRDPAMRQMFTSMMKNMSPEMMTNMSEQFGVKLSKEDAAKAQQAMSSLSPDDLERMMRWMERAQKGVEAAKKTKNWLLGKPGMILAICMLVLAFILHKLGFIGG